MSQKIEQLVAMTLEFKTTFQQPDNPDLQASLVIEEAKEVCLAMDVFCSEDGETVENVAELLKEFADFIYVTTGMMNYTQDVAQAALKSNFDADPQNQFEFEGAVLAMRFLQYLLDDEILEEAIARVHASNMTKLGDDGQPIFNEAGKVLKGPNYVPADLTDLAVKVLDNLATARADTDEATEALLKLINEALEDA